MNRVRLVIVDDHPVLRMGLRDLLSAVPEFDVIGEAENGAQALELIDTVSPDLAIVDIDMPVLDGIELAKLLRSKQVRTHIVFLTIHRDRSLYRSLARMGVRGYVLKDSATEEIVDCVRAVVSGDRFVSPQVISVGESAGPTLLVGIESLTLSEIRVLALISDSRTNREIAEGLSVSVRTIETHRYNICSKLDLKGSHALLKFAVENKSSILNAYKLRETT